MKSSNGKRLTHTEEMRIYKAEAKFYLSEAEFDLQKAIKVFNQEFELD